MAVAIDGRYHGERAASGKGSADYQVAILRAYRQPGSEHPFFFDSRLGRHAARGLFGHAAMTSMPRRIGLMGILKGRH